MAPIRASNAGLPYTAKGTAPLLVPTGNWHAVFIVGALNGVAALMAWYVLRPMRRAEMEKALVPAAAPGSKAGFGHLPQSARSAGKKRPEPGPRPWRGNPSCHAVSLGQ